MKKNCISFKLFSSPPITRKPAVFRNQYWKSVWFNDEDEPLYQMGCQFCTLYFNLDISQEAGWPDTEEVQMQKAADLKTRTVQTSKVSET